MELIGSLHPVPRRQVRGLSFDDWVEPVMVYDAAETSHDDAIHGKPIDVEAIMRATIEEHDHAGLCEAPPIRDALTDENSR